MGDKLESAVFKEIHGVLENADPKARAGVGGLAGAFAQLFFAGPVGVVGGMVESLGMGHEAEDAAGGIADAGDVVEGAVGVVGECSLGRLAVGAGVSDDDLSF